MSLGKPLETQRHEVEPVLTKLAHSSQPITTRYVNILLKQLSHQAIEQFIDQPHRVKRFKTFLAHWLRHQSASMQDRAGIKDTHTKDNHRHAKIDIARQYIHALDKERHHEMNKLRLKYNHRSNFE